MTAFGARMSPTWTRRQLLRGTLGTLAAACDPSRVAGPVKGPKSGARSFGEIEASVGGRVGVFAFDTGTGRQLAHRPDERFAMCSTFKWVLAAAVLGRVDRGELSLGDRVPYGANDLIEHAPVTGERVRDGAMTVDALAEAAVTVSDNTAANLLLAKVDGPAGLTRFSRSFGDTVTRLDRDEPTLNDNTPGDPRDKTSPRAMATLMRRLLLDDGLSAASRERLLGWLRACETGKDRLRAGLPVGWTVADKTGTGQRGSVNDVAIAWPPDRPPVVIAAYLSDSEAELDMLARAHAEIGRLVAHQL